MSSRLALKHVLVGCILLILICGCSKNRNSIYSKVKDYTNTVKIINTHEHQRDISDFEGQDHNFYFLLANSYLQYDLVSAGAEPLNPDKIKTHSLEALWDLYGPYLNFCSFTSFYSHFLSGFKQLYDFEDLYFSKENTRPLSVEIERNYKNYKSWFDEVFHKVHYELMFVDQYWNSLNTNLNEKYFALVFNINQFVYGISNRPALNNKDLSTYPPLYKIASDKGFEITKLDDFLSFTEHLLEQFQKNKVVCFKNTLAYGRTLDFEYISYEKAKALFNRNTKDLSDLEKKNLQDFMFHWIIQKSIEVNLPIQIHTGYLAGNGNTLENSHPIKLNKLFLRYPDAKFVLFHGGYPWTGEYSALAKMFANVYLDIVWLPQISREAAIKALDEMLDCVPYNKFSWGGDCHFIEESVGSLEFAKEVITQVLIKRINRGLMTENTAFDVIRKIFRENAIHLFNLEKKLNIVL
jgi:hypothetical protein